MSRRAIIIVAASLLLAGLAAWAGWTIAAHQADAKAQQLYAEIARHSGARLEAERQRAELETALEAKRAELDEAEAVLQEKLASHRQVVAQISARLRAMGQQLEADHLTERGEDDSLLDTQSASSNALELGLEAPAGLTLEDAWSGWRSCEATLGAALNARDECRQTVEAQDALLEASGRVEEEFRAEVAARQDLEQQLRSVARRRKWKHRLEGVGLYLAGVGSAKMLGLPD